MRRVFICLTAMVLAAMTVGCKKEVKMPLAGFQNGYFSLNEVSAENYPARANNWKIDDVVVSSVDELYGLRDALYSAAAEGRKIKITADNLNKIPGSTTSQTAAFYDCDALVSISLASVSSVGDHAFGFCDNLSKVSLPGVTSVGDGAFFDCNSLLGVDLPMAAQVGASAFEHCDKLQKVELPLATSIGASTFLDCDLLKSLTLPLVTSVGDSAFRSCDALVSIQLPSLTTLGDGCFAYCSSSLSLISVSAYGVLESVVESAFTSTKTTNITLLLGLGNGSYVTGTKLSKGDFTAVFKEISVEGEPDAAFSSLADYSASKYPERSNYWTIDNSVVASVDDLANLRAAINAAGKSGRRITLVASALKSLPDAVSSAKGAFSGCQALVKVDMPSLVSVGHYAFSYCEGLAEVSLPAATSIGSYAFYSCKSLNTLYAPVANFVGGNAFSLCTSLATLSLPEAVTVEYSGFNGCAALINVALPKATTLEANSFGGCSSLLTFEIATGAKLNSMSASTFTDTDTTTVEFTTGVANAGFVTGQTLSIGDLVVNFKSIVLK